MALINCGECGREISDRASSCPGCGAPIGTDSAQPTVIEQTSKTWKGQILLAIMVGVMGLVLGGIGGANDSTFLAVFGAALIGLGALWFVVALIGAWWHHG